MKNNILSIIYMLLFTFVLSSYLVAQNNNVVKQNYTTVKRTVQEEVKKYIDIFVRQDKRYVGYQSASIILDHCDNYVVIKEYEKKLKPILLKKIQYDAPSRKILALLSMDKQTQSRLYQLCSNDQDEVKAKLGYQDAMTRINEKITRHLSLSDLNTDSIDLYVNQLLYIQNTKSDGILCKLLSSNLTIQRKCTSYLVTNKYGANVEKENWTKSIALFYYVLTIFNQQYFDYELSPELFEKKPLNDEVRLIPSSYQQQLERIFSQKYNFNIKINAPFISKDTKCK